MRLAHLAYMQQAPVLFQGSGHSLNPTNSLVLKVLSASPTTFFANPKSKVTTPPSLNGTSIIQA
ncbi:hypothetical protein JHK87_044541 [Glycine soja]|nr:hypothetical protein JHK87_044541 [Glycine soja]